MEVLWAGEVKGDLVARYARIGIFVYVMNQKG
jgi:hypothetical protein